MDWWTKLKRIMGVPEDDFIADEQETDEIETENKRSSFFAGRKRKEVEADEPIRRAEERVSVRREPRKETRTVSRGRDEKYMNIHATTQLQVVLVKPEEYQEATQIADHLINKNTVLLNLEGVDRETVRRMIDFLGGVAYAQGGMLKRVANGTFIITPYDVDIVGDVLDELKIDHISF